MNHVILSGTAFEPNTRIAKSGMAVLTFRLSYYQGKGKDGKTAYGSIDVTAFDKLAQAWDGKLQDRDKVIVIGRLMMDKWEKDGQKHYKHGMIADNIGKEMNLFASSANSAPVGQYISDEEVPF